MVRVHRDRPRSALTLVLVQFDVFKSRLPEFQLVLRRAELALRSASRWPSTKILHEFGHGLSCKHFGGECHEMGVMFLVLTPCLYCNVSDSWMLPNSWHRAAIGAAGMYVEAGAGVDLHVHLVVQRAGAAQLHLPERRCSSARSARSCSTPTRCCGTTATTSSATSSKFRTCGRRRARFSIASSASGASASKSPKIRSCRKRHQMALRPLHGRLGHLSLGGPLSILFFLNKVFEPYGLKVLGQAIALASIYGLLVQPLVKLV